MPEKTNLKSPVIDLVIPTFVRSFTSCLKAVGAEDFTLTYDVAADVSYLRFNEVEADDSVLTEDNVVLRYKDGKLIGMTVLGKK